MRVIFSKIELEISPFLAVIQFYSNIGKKRVGKIVYVWEDVMVDASTLLLHSTL